MNKLNFGCGDKIANGWINIDFHSGDSRVKRVNLLKGFPYPDNYFDVVYSSHVLEHFTQEQALFLLREAYRVLKPVGILRIVVPDLAGTCKEYLRILALPDDDNEKNQLYEWIIIELLDQLVRSQPTGEMGRFVNKLKNSGNETLIKYVYSRTENTPITTLSKTSFLEKLQSLTPQKFFTKLNYWYLSCVAGLIPKHLRSMVLVESGIGEKHRWMYDQYGLTHLFMKAGFSDCKSLAYNESSIPDFQKDCLDNNPDGSYRKGNSIYLEASKPLNNPSTSSFTR